MRPISVALVHYPVVGRQGQLITTAITNLDIHDIARSSRTYCLENVFLVHPVLAQRTLAERICGHWIDGAGGKRIPDRSAALELVRAVPALDDALAAFGAAHGGVKPEVWTTAAQARGEVLSFREARARVASDGPPVLLVYGTGWGLAAEVLDRATVRLAPIEGRGDWNHLSVRAACAISLDRLLGEW